MKSFRLNKQDRAASNTNLKDPGSGDVGDDISISKSSTFSSKLSTSKSKLRSKVSFSSLTSRNRKSSNGGDNLSYQQFRDQDGGDVGDGGVVDVSDAVSVGSDVSGLSIGTSGTASGKSGKRKKGLLKKLSIRKKSSSSRAVMTSDTSGTSGTTDTIPIEAVTAEADSGNQQVTADSISATWPLQRDQGYLEQLREESTGDIAMGDSHIDIGASPSAEEKKCPDDEILPELITEELGNVADPSGMDKDMKMSNEEGNAMDKIGQDTAVPDDINVGNDAQNQTKNTPSSHSIKEVNNHDPTAANPIKTKFLTELFIDDRPTDIPPSNKPGRPIRRIASQSEMESPTSTNSLSSQSPQTFQKSRRRSSCSGSGPSMTNMPKRHTVRRRSSCPDRFEEGTETKNFDLTSSLTSSFTSSKPIKSKFLEELFVGVGHDEEKDVSSMRRSSSQPKISSLVHSTSQGSLSGKSALRRSSFQGSVGSNPSKLKKSVSFVSSDEADTGGESKTPAEPTTFVAEEAGDESTETTDETRRSKRSSLSMSLHLDDIKEGFTAMLMGGGNDEEDIPEDSMDFGEKRATPQGVSRNQAKAASMGLMSQNTWQQFMEPSKFVGDSDNREDEGAGEGETVEQKAQSVSLENARRMSDHDQKMARMGLMSQKSIKRMSGVGLPRRSLSWGMSESSDNESEEEEDVIEHMKEQHRPESEIRSARKGIMSRKTMSILRKPSDLDDDVDEDNEESMIDQVTGEEEDTDFNSDVQNDILTEGQHYLGISMMVYMYSTLRETCRMGHTTVHFQDIDVNSLQSQYHGFNGKYLSKTKTAGSIVRVVIDELDVENKKDEEENEMLMGDREYEKSIMEEFRLCIQESRENQLDEETERMIAALKRKVARHRWKRAIAAVRLSYKLSGGKRPKFEAPIAAPGCENENRFVDMNEIMSKAIKNQPKYFREGSVMNNLIESGIEVVWFSDWTQSDLVYGICCQRDQKKVTVVFRGTVTSHNWQMNLKMGTTKYPNPVKASYPERDDEISIHSGFALYLLRKRKDTGMSKIQEIFQKIDEIGREMAPNGDYKLSITGHSLGGALATLLGFYIASKPRFANIKTVYIWTFASPRVGTGAFLHAYQYLERKGRIRHARFSATNDMIPLGPFFNFSWEDLQFYHHVGMRVQLHGTGRHGKRRLRKAIDVTYPLHHGFRSVAKRVLMNNFITNLNTPAGFSRNHTLTEHQKRIHFTLQYRKALGSGVFFSDQKRNRIKTLDEYYSIRANMNADGSTEGDDAILKVIQNEKTPSKVDPRKRKQVVVLCVLLLLVVWIVLLKSMASHF